MVHPEARVTPQSVPCTTLPAPPLRSDPLRAARSAAALIYISGAADTRTRLAVPRVPVAVPHQHPALPWLWERGDGALAVGLLSRAKVFVLSC